MKYILTCLLVAFGFTTACGQAKEQREQSRINSSFAELRLSSSEAQQNFKDMEVKEFAELIADSNVVILDVRKADEFAEGHIKGAILIDQFQSDFMEQAQAKLPKDKTIAIYCRSGRRSANAAGKLTAVGNDTTHNNVLDGLTIWARYRRYLLSKESAPFVQLRHAAKPSGK